MTRDSGHDSAGGDKQIVIDVQKCRSPPPLSSPSDSLVTPNEGDLKCVEPSSPTASVVAPSEGALNPGEPSSPTASVVAPNEGLTPRRPPTTVPRSSINRGWR